MRISDWSSDVCSSDLRPRPASAGRRGSLPAPRPPRARAPAVSRRRLRADACWNESRLVSPEWLDMSIAGTATSLDAFPTAPARTLLVRSEEHTSELQSLMRLSYAVFCLKKNTIY